MTVLECSSMTEQEMVSLRDYIDARINELDRRISEAYVTEKELQKAVEYLTAQTLPREYYERRHTELMNSTTTRIGELRDYHDRDLERNEARITSLERWRANLSGRMVGFGAIGALVIAGFTALISHLITGS